MVNLSSRQSSPPKSEPIGRVMSGANGGILEAACKNTHRIPEGLKVPESWHHPHEHLRCGPPGWVPKFEDDPDVEARLGKDVENFTPEEFDIFKQTEDFGIPYRQ